MDILSGAKKLVVGLLRFILWSLLNGLILVYIIRCTREEYLERKMELEEKVLGFKEKMKLLEDSLVNGLELQIKDTTGLEVMGKYLKVEKLTKELVDAVVEKIVVGKGKEVEVGLKNC